ncbi:PAS/PAC sensor hybrid histidine kinase [Magnetococcus marinus MC-1]|uniref:Sensory/regulatory protein RpfC n=1 Tax=Magnetococcus marinus (strain ATCC BAA-1437 / JCM 17883 / MC-1) TaxID=156889 RepID=A0LB01_MAGMM|nr:ATP-binding protein [Magnetococcus marinus]ABK45144.1 PAS/PAC sensor hybrid histidine kinase [Magnetococcus marinus MC-1]
MLWRTTHKAALAVGLLASAFIIAITWQSQHLLENDAIHNRNLALEDTAEHFSWTLQSRIFEIRDQLRALASNSLVANALADDKGREIYLPTFFSGIQTIGGVPARLSLTNFLGREVVSSQPQLPLLLETELIGAAIQTTQPLTHVHPVDGGSLYMIMMEPVIYANTGMAEGALILQIRISDLLDHKQIHSFWEHSRQITGLGMTFHALGHNKPITLTVGKSRRTSISRILRLDEQHQGNIRFTADVVLFTTDDYFQTAMANKRQDFLMLGLAWIGIAILSAWLLVTWLNRRLNEVARELRGLNLSGASFGRLKVQGEDEVRQVAEAFNAVLERLESAYGELAKKSARQMQLEREKYRGVVDQAGESLLIFDLDGRVVEANSAAEKLLGYRRVTLLNYTQDQLLAPNSTLTIPNHDGDNAENPSHVTFETRLHTADGQDLEVEVWAGFLEIDYVQHTLWLARDITDRKRLEAEMVAARDMAEKAYQAKSIFLATMSHEIRTPMNAILGTAELLAETELDADQSRYVRMFTSAGENLLQVINDILDISKFEAGHIELEQRVFSVREMMGDLHKLLAYKCKEKGLYLLVNASETTPDSLIGDPTRLRQVLINLLGNAIKFTDTGTVALLAHSEQIADKQVQLAFHVVDTGIGISDADQEKVFRPFEQAGTYITRTHGGTGLGLSICQSLIHKMGGKITVHSRADHGSTFTAQVNLDLAEESTAQNFSRLLTGQSALVIHDHVIHHHFFEEGLVSIGASIKSFGNLEQLEMSVRRSREDGGVDFLLIHHEKDRLAPSTEANLVTIRGLPGMAQLPILLCGNLQTVETIQRLEALRVVFISDHYDKHLFFEGVRRALEIVKDQPMLENASADSTCLSILLAEDSHDNIELFQAFLKHTPYRVTVVNDGAQAVGKVTVKKDSFNLVFMDIQMPIMDGLTATRAIRDWEKENHCFPITIVALTAHAMEEHQQETIQAGCNSYLTKPIKKRDLLGYLDRFSRSGE